MRLVLSLRSYYLVVLTLASGCNAVWRQDAGRYPKWKQKVLLIHPSESSHPSSRRMSRPLRTRHPRVE